MAASSASVFKFVAMLPTLQYLVLGLGGPGEASPVRRSSRGGRMMMMMAAPASCALSRLILLPPASVTSPHVRAWPVSVWPGPDVTGLVPGVGADPNSTYLPGSSKCISDILRVPGTGKDCRRGGTYFIPVVSQILQYKA
eukprot:425833-Rhodomonas_salina.1